MPIIYGPGGGDAMAAGMNAIAESKTSSPKDVPSEKLRNWLIGTLIFNLLMWIGFFVMYRLYKQEWNAVNNLLKTKIGERISEDFSYEPLLSQPVLSQTRRGTTYSTSTQQTCQKTNVYVKKPCTIDDIMSEEVGNCDEQDLRTLLEKVDNKISSVKGIGLLFFIVIGVLTMGLVMHYYCSAIEETDSPSIKDEYKGVYDYEKKEFTNNFYYAMDKFGALCWYIFAGVCGITLFIICVAAWSGGRW